jgi:hypothetical protein
MENLTDDQRLEAQKLTDDYAKTLKTRNKPAAIPAGESFAAEKQETAFNDLRRLTVVHSVKDSIKQYILQRQSTIAANKKKKEEAEKLRQNGWQST